MEPGSQRPIVIKIGGSTLGAHDTSLRDCVELYQQGRRVVLVHGGGAIVSEWLARPGTPSEFVGGLRKTTEESREVVVAVLAGLINKSLVQQLAALGVRAVGLSGADGGMVQSPMNEQGLGFVGDAPVCDPRALRAVLAAGFLPIVAPIGLTPDGSALLNINADSVAGAIAAAAEAEQLIILSDVPGILDGRGTLIEELDGKQADQLCAEGTIDGGMLPKVAACQAAAAAGAEARIVDGRVTGAIPAALAGELGTRVR